MSARRSIPAVLLVVALLLAACGQSDSGVDQDPDIPPADPSELVTEDDLGEEWPLIPTEATVSCAGTEPDAPLAIEAQGITYGLDEAGEREFARISPILAGDPNDPASREALAPLIEIARGLCDD